MNEIRYTDMICWWVVYFRRRIFSRNNFFGGVYIKSTSVIALHLYAYEGISFKLGMMIDTTKLHSLRPVLNDFYLIRKLEVVQSLCCQVA